MKPKYRKARGGYNCLTINVRKEGQLRLTIVKDSPLCCFVCGGKEGGHEVWLQLLLESSHLQKLAKACVKMVEGLKNE